MDLSELPPFEELVKEYDIEFCKIMIECVNRDIHNLNNRSSKMIEMSAKMRDLPVDKYIQEERDLLNSRIKLLKDRIEELS